MILVDVNLLIYATNTDASQHVAARQWLDEKLAGPPRVGIPWPSVVGFLRITTNPRAFARPLTMVTAWKQVEDWLRCETVWTPHPTERHSQVFANLLGQPGVQGNLVSDAHLAALAIEHGLTLCSTDGDFARFRDLKWLDPLAG
ncbi:MAG TPA: type II toxin-antitoxin system VapC family toxin [Pseudolabrys sp.]|nr:type II toxin-antitoxin system VapC family toxin [Pseudolabrys sp.]